MSSEKEKELGKRDGSLALTVGANKGQLQDGDTPAEPVKSGQCVLVDPAVEEMNEEKGVQVDEESLPGDFIDEIDLPADEKFPADSVLLCVEGCLNGISVIFLIDSGASECFVGKTFAEENGLKLTKTKEKLKYT